MASGVLRRLGLLGLVCVIGGAAIAAPMGKPTPPAQADVTRALVEGSAALIEMAEPAGKGEAQWPYEGVYRVRGEIPIGYRIGGTAIACLAMHAQPIEGEDGEASTADAIERGVRFVVNGIKHPLMSYEQYDAGYDVRGWGYTYALAMLLELERDGALPEALAEEAKAAARWYLDAIQATEIPQSGGWNYARPRGKDRPAASSPFMTGPTLQALFLAKALGYAVDEGVVERGLSALENSIAESGEVVYSGSGERTGGVPGAVGRMMVTQTTLHLAGRAELSDVRASVDAFLAHWWRLEERRAKNGTHDPPFGVAPYYFFYAHRYAAQAIERLPMRERTEYRGRLAELLFSIRNEDGSWNDRVFPRSANYGTAMTILALTEPTREAPAEWSTDDGDDAPGEE